MTKRKNKPKRKVKPDLPGTERKPLKDPQPGDVFSMRPIGPLGRAGTIYEVKIVTKVLSANRERFVRGVRRGKDYVTYTRLPGPETLLHYASVASLVSRFRDEHAVVIGGRS